MIRHLSRVLEAASCSTRARGGSTVGKNDTQSPTTSGPLSGYWSLSRVENEICLVRRMSITSTEKLTASMESMAGW